MSHVPTSTEARINYRNIVLSIAILSVGILFGINSAATNKQEIVIGFTTGTEAIKAIAPHAAVMEAMPSMTYNTTYNSVASSLSFASLLPIVLVLVLILSILMGMFSMRGGMGG